MTQTQTPRDDAILPLTRLIAVAVIPFLLAAFVILYLLPGQVKIKCGGGHAGHNGLRDIHAQLGSADYWRLRLGIGHPGVKAEVVDYVLRKPAPEQRELIETTIARSVDTLDLLLAGEMERAMMKVHAKPPRPKPAVADAVPGTGPAR